MSATFVPIGEAMTPVTTTQLSAKPLVCELTASAATAEVTPESARPSPLHPAGSSIDLLTPQEVQRRLAMSDDALILLVNRGALAAYNLGGNLRFRSGDVQALETQLSAEPQDLSSEQV